MLTRRAAVLFAVIFAFSLFAGTPMTISPAPGPTSGETEVTITGDFSGGFPPEVPFGNVPVVRFGVDSDVPARVTISARDGVQELVRETVTNDDTQHITVLWPQP